MLAIGHGNSNEPFAPGTRVNPEIINADDLAWSLLTPAGSTHRIQSDCLR